MPNYFKQDDKNKERREERIERENLIRNYQGDLDAVLDELREKERKQQDLETRIRFQEKTIQDHQDEIEFLTHRLQRLKTKLKRDKFELNQNKAQIDEIKKRISYLKKRVDYFNKKLKEVKIT